MLPGITMTDDASASQVALASISVAMASACILFVGCSMGIVALVIFFLAKSKLIRERKQMGIWKALGFSTAQLIVQTIISYVPVISLGAVLGVIGGYFLINPIVVAALAFCGIKELDLELQMIYMVLTVVGMSLTALLVSGACALRIRKSEAYRMIQE
jgi:putative ABC transport system permease protein